MIRRVSIPLRSFTLLNDIMVQLQSRRLLCFRWYTADCAIILTLHWSVALIWYWPLLANISESMVKHTITTSWPVGRMCSGTPREIQARVREDIVDDDIDARVANATETVIISRAISFIKGTACEKNINEIWRYLRINPLFGLFVWQINRFTNEILLTKLSVRIL